MLLRLPIKIIRKVQHKGLSDFADAIGQRARRGKIRGFGIVAKSTRDKRGIEIGGPSPAIFGPHSLLPVYSIAANIDNCNFASRTIWEGKIEEGPSFEFSKERPAGYQYIREGTALTGIADASYDFLLSSHTLEHIANPLKALREWQRVIKDGGALIIVVPHRDGTFDHRRDITSLEHMIDDDLRGVGEDDLTHLEEILALHDRSMHPVEHFRKRSLDNFNNRCLHHHTFSARSLVALLDYAKIELLLVRVQRPFHIIALGRKSSSFAHAVNKPFLIGRSAYLRRSPFPTDNGT